MKRSKRIIAGVVAFTFLVVTLVFLRMADTVLKEYAATSCDPYLYAAGLSPNQPAGSLATSSAVDSVSLNPTGSYVSAAKSTLNLSVIDTFKDYAGQKKTNVKRKSNLAEIDGVSIARGLSVRERKIPLSAALQESNGMNVPFGDRDSLGVFQQRAGWGTASQRMNIQYATNKFIDALMRSTTAKQRRTLPIIELAIKVQIPNRSAYYGRWHWDKLVDAMLTGQSGTNPYADGSAPQTLLQDTFNLSNESGCANPCVQNYASVDSLTIASANVLMSNSVENTVRGIEGLMDKGADIIGTQEVARNAQRIAVRQLALRKGFGMTSKGTSTPILWRKSKLEKLDEDTARIIPFTHVENGGSGTGLGPRNMSWVKLRVKATGAIIIHDNDHIVPTIDRGGKPDKRRPLRLKLYDDQMRAAEKVIKEHESEGIVTKTDDGNVDVKADMEHKDPFFPVARFGRLGMVSNYQVLGFPEKASHATRYIDVVWVKQSQAAVPVAQEIVDLPGSDHKALMVHLKGQATSVADVDVAKALAASINQGATVSSRAGTPPPLTSGFVTATWNINTNNTSAYITEGVNALKANGANMIALQEVGKKSNYRVVQRALGVGWQLTTPRSSNPIAWQTSVFTYLDQGKIAVYGDRRVENGASGTHVAGKSVVWVKLKVNATGQVVFFISHHMIASVESAGKPNGKHLRLALYMDQMGVILNLIRKFSPQGSVKVFGDDNVDAEKDEEVKDPSFPFMLLGNSGMSSNWHQLGVPKGDGTHKGRTIDYVWSESSDTFKPDSQKILPVFGKAGADNHRPVLVSFNGNGTFAGSQNQNCDANSAIANTNLQAMFDFATAQIGKHYVLGDGNPNNNTFDCSELTQLAFKAAGVKLPRVAQAQYTATKKYAVSRSELRKGDLLFFDTIPGNGVPVDHVGIYWGDNKILHAPNPRKLVGIYSLGGDSGYYWPKLVGASRPIQQVKAASSSVSLGDWQFPLSKRYAITSQFKMRHHPVTGVYKLHDGTDYGAPAGTPILAVADGVIASASPSSGYGNYVTISHDRGKVITGYAHMSRMSVHKGEPVKKGQVIGYVGSTGFVTGAHLHFNVRVIGTHSKFCSGNGGSKCNGHNDWVEPNDFITDANYRARLLGTRNDFVPAA